MRHPADSNLGYRIGAVPAVPLIKAITKRSWLGTENIPRDGAVIFYMNHTSYADPLVTSLYFYENGRAVRFFGKDSLFRLPLVGWIIRKAEQIPVDRESDSAAAALEIARELLEKNLAVGIYPEGTLTRDPQLWPMQAKTGAVRLALLTDAPLIPVAQWGAHKIIGRYQRKLKLFPKTKVVIKAGKPLDLSKWKNKTDDHNSMVEATAYAMKELTSILAQLRGEPVPEKIFDPHASDLPRTGNFKKNRKP